MARTTGMRTAGVHPTRRRATGMRSTMKISMEITMETMMEMGATKIGIDNDGPGLIPVVIPWRAGYIVIGVVRVVDTAAYNHGDQEQPNNGKERFHNQLLRPKCMSFKSDFHLTMADGAKARRDQGKPL